MTQDGVETPVTGPAREYTNPRVSPDGGRILSSGGDGLWTLDLGRGAVTKVAPSGAGYALWAGPDRIVFRSSTALTMMRADGTGELTVLDATSSNDFPASVSPDGRTLAFVRISPSTSGDLYVAPLDGTEAPRPFLATQAYEGGGLHPLWSPDGRHIYYREGQRLMAVDVALGPEPALSAPRLLFDHQYRFGPNLSVPHYSLSPDGRKFLFVREEPGARSIDLVTNWLQTLSRR